MKENDFCIDCLRYNGGCDFRLKPINNKGKIDCFLREEKYDKKDYKVYVVMGDGECEEHERQQQNGIERLVVYIQPVEHKDGQLAQQIAGGSAYHKLYHERES